MLPCGQDGARRSAAALRTTSASCTTSREHTITLVHDTGSKQEDTRPYHSFLESIQTIHPRLAYSAVPARRANARPGDTSLWHDGQIDRQASCVYTDS
jgi:hypothetical protein